MLPIEDWLARYLLAVTDTFADRLRFVGLQGSYRRGEATDESDIDVVLVLDTLELSDLAVYRTLVRTLPHADKVCGFVCGLPELARWPASDLFQFVHETRPLYGSLEGLLPSVSRADIVQSVRLGASALYHAVCHSYLFADAAACLPSLSKQAWFLLQERAYLLYGVYAPTPAELLPLLSEPDAVILRLYQHRRSLPALPDKEVAACFDQLLIWSRTLLSVT